MRNFVLILLLVALAASLSACQGFLEDYSYKPLGTSSGSY